MHMFATMLDTSLTLTTLPDVGRLPEFKMAAIKPEVEITFKRREMKLQFQLLPHIFDHARLRYDFVILVRRRPTTEIQYGDRRNRK